MSSDSEYEQENSMQYSAIESVIRVSFSLSGNKFDQRFNLVTFERRSF